MFRHRFEPAPAPVDFRLKLRQGGGVFGAQEVSGFSHRGEPIGKRDFPLEHLRIVTERGQTVLDFVEREEAGVDRLLQDLVAGPFFGAPIERAGREQFSEGQAVSAGVKMYS